MEPRVKAFTDNRKKVVKWQYLLHISLQYGELRPTNVWDLLASLGFVTAPTSPNESQPNFARRLAVSCTGILYMHFWRLLPPNRIWQLQNSLCVQLLRSPKLAALLQCTALEHWRQPKFAAWYKEWNYGTFAEGATYMRQGGHHVWHRPTF